MIVLISFFSGSAFSFYMRDSIYEMLNKSTRRISRLLQCAKMATALDIG